MATIRWNKKSRLLFRDYIAYAQIEFGEETASRWYKQIYISSSDTVRIVDIWDMRMKPETLKDRIK